MPDADRTRAPCVQGKLHIMHASNHRAAEQPALPAQWCYGLYVISSVRRAVWPPSSSRNVTRELDPSVGGSGPHDFAVRSRRTRLMCRLTSIASRANVRDDREAPLPDRRGMRG